METAREDSAALPVVDEPREPATTADSRPAGRWARVRRELAYLRGEAHLRWRIADVLARLMPVRTLSTARARLYRAAGFDIAPGVSFVGAFTLVGGGDVYGRLHIGRGCFISEGVLLNLDDSLRMGEAVSLGPRVSIYTSTHDVGPASRRMSPEVVARPVVIEDGAWIAAGALVLAGVTIGRGAVVAAGSIVTDDVPANTLVAGNPARVVRELSD
jgi:acetyltransferase-like isoleucine patch superfamily enzyme